MSDCYSTGNKIQFVEHKLKIQLIEAVRNQKLNQCQNDILRKLRLAYFCERTYLAKHPRSRRRNKFGYYDSLIFLTFFRKKKKSIPRQSVVTEIHSVITPTCNNASFSTGKSARLNFKRNLIEEIRIHDNLWNPLLPLYYDEVVKMDTWNQIASKLNNTVHECQQMFNALHDHYFKMNNEDDNNKHWEFYDSLRFLDATEFITADNLMEKRISTEDDCIFTNAENSLMEEALVPQLLPCSQNNETVAHNTTESVSFQVQLWSNCFPLEEIGISNSTKSSAQSCSTLVQNDLMETSDAMSSLEKFMSKALELTEPEQERRFVQVPLVRRKSSSVSAIETFSPIIVNSRTTDLPAFAATLSPHNPSLPIECLTKVEEFESLFDSEGVHAVNLCSTNRLSSFYFNEYVPAEASSVHSLERSHQMYISNLVSSKVSENCEDSNFVMSLPKMESQCNGFVHHQLLDQCSASRSSHSNNIHDNVADTVLKVVRSGMVESSQQSEEVHRKSNIELGTIHEDNILYVARIILTKFSGPFERHRNISQYCAHYYKNRTNISFTTSKLDEVINSFPELFALMEHTFSPLIKSITYNLKYVVFKPPNYIDENDLKKFGVSLNDYQNRFHVDRKAFQKAQRLSCGATDPRFQEFLVKRNQLFGIIGDTSQEDFLQNGTIEQTVNNVPKIIQKRKIESNPYCDEFKVKVGRCALLYGVRSAAKEFSKQLNKPLSYNTVLGWRDMIMAKEQENIM